MLAAELYRRFHAMKTWGKEPESLESIIAVFMSDLAQYPVADLLTAIRLHAQRSAEFPTTADIAGLIRRRGRPPLSEALFVSISRKAYQDRSPEEHAYFREYVAEQHEECPEFTRLERTAVNREQLERLRKENIALRAENDRLARLLHETRLSRHLEPLKPDVLNKVARTVAQMQADGAPANDIEEFRRLMQVA